MYNGTRLQAEENGSITVQTVSGHSFEVQGAKFDICETGIRISNNGAEVGVGAQLEASLSLSINQITKGNVLILGNPHSNPVRPNPFTATTIEAVEGTIVNGQFEFVKEEGLLMTSERKQYIGQRFESQDVELDGGHFERCIFRHCKLIYRGGMLPDFIGNDLADCNFKLEDAAKQTILFCRALGKMGLGNVVDAIIGEIRKPLT